MKNMKRFLTLCLALCMVLSVAVFAEAGAPGTIKEITYAGADYADGDVNFALTYDDATENGMYLILVLSEEGTPKNGNILYVNQVTADADGAYFENVYPTEIGEEESYIYLAGPEGYKPLGKIIPNVADTDVTVIPVGVGEDAYTVEGRKVTVDYALPCKLGYEKADGTYAAIVAEANGDGTYSYNVPEGIDEVVLVVKGDVSGDGKLLGPDIIQAKAAQLGKLTVTELKKFAADVSGDGKLLGPDIIQAKAAQLGKLTLKW